MKIKSWKFSQTFPMHLWCQVWSEDLVEHPYSLLLRKLPISSQWNPAASPWRCHHLHTQVSPCCPSHLSPLEWIQVRDIYWSCISASWQYCADILPGTWDGASRLPSSTSLAGLCAVWQLSPPWLWPCCRPCLLTDNNTGDFSEWLQWIFICKYHRQR